MMFAQVNSEHCRHKIFNSRWTIDGQPRGDSLFDLIRSTHAAAPDGTLVAYRRQRRGAAGTRDAPPDAAPVGRRCAPRCTGPPTRLEHIVFKVETHNHPTAIAPFPGAATAPAATSAMSRPLAAGPARKAGLCGFSVSNLGSGNERAVGIGPRRDADRRGREAAIMAFRPESATRARSCWKGRSGAAPRSTRVRAAQSAGYFRAFQQNVGRRASAYTNRS